MLAPTVWYVFVGSYAMAEAANAHKYLVDRCFHEATAAVPPGPEQPGQWKAAVKPREEQLEELVGCYYRALDSAKSGEAVRPHNRAGAGRQAVSTNGVATGGRPASPHP